jgi:hypothetical protein
MRKWIAISSIVILFLVCQVAAGQTRYENYTNVRFNYTIEYPADLLLPKDEAANGDGRIFSARHGPAELRVWGQYNAMVDTLKKAYLRDLKKRGEGVTYKLLKNDSYVISGVEDGRIYYQKTILSGKDGDGGAVFATFALEYDLALRKIYDGVATRVSRSFRFQ